MLDRNLCLQGFQLTHGFAVFEVELGEEVAVAINRNRQAFATARTLGLVAKPQHTCFGSFADVAFRMRLLSFFLVRDCPIPPALRNRVCSWPHAPASPAVTQQGLDFAGESDGADVLDSGSLLQETHVAMESVFENVIHSDPACVPDPSDDLVADEIWASRVESRLGAESSRATHISDHTCVDPSVETNSEQEGELTDEVYLLQFSRNPEIFQKALEQSVSLKACRLALEESGHAWNLQSGAKIFVHPSQYVEAMEFLIGRGEELRPYHVVVAQSMEHLIHESLVSIPCRQSVRIKKRATLGSTSSSKRMRPNTDEHVHGCTVQHDVQESAKSEDGECPSSDDGLECQPMLVCEKRTFLCCLPRFRSASSVVQSTTEAHGGINPRRVMAMTLSDAES